jgi:hypothetical protein
MEKFRKIRDEGGWRAQSVGGGGIMEQMAEPSTD